jgi:hypothetical protein
VNVRSFTITVGYNACYVFEVEVHADAVERACERAIAIANVPAEGWRPTSGATSSYVEAIETAGETIPVPEKFTQVAVLVPQVTILHQGLELITTIAEGQWTDAGATLERIRGAARDALDRARH